MKVAIVGGGIGGLCLALALHQRGIACEVFEAVPEVREIGAGITLLPHASGKKGLSQPLFAARWCMRVPGKSPTWCTGYA